MCIIYRLPCFLLLMLSTFTVSAEGRCPPGYFPTTNPDFVGCAPIYNSSSGTGYSSSSTPKPPDPGPRWKFRWGAIVVDRETGTFGGADGFERPSQAKKAAIKDCRTNGGKRCKLLIEYYNQCGVLVAGDNMHEAFAGPVAEQIKKRAIESCSKTTANCQIHYLGCSYPVEVE